ncbi:MAG: ABC transporter permease [Actinobacteria bacterium]|nr:ABC transporter permease [Actinomycetota bacterium]
MSTSTLTSPTETSVQVQSAAGAVHLTFPRVVRSEWIKFRTLRSTIWTLAITLVVMVGIVTLFSAVAASQLSNTQSAEGDGGSIVVFMIAAGMAQLAVAVLGTLVITGEYSTGMIRSTLAAVPRRLAALWAKAIVLAVSIFLVSIVAVALSLAVMQLFLGDKGVAPDLGNPETLRILVGTALYLTGIAGLAFAIGALLRHSAGALATVLGLLLVIESLAHIPWRPLQLIVPFLPGTAGSKLMLTQAQIDATSQGAVGAVLGPWQGFAVLIAWVAVLLTAAAVLIRRRDA